MPSACRSLDALIISPAVTSMLHATTQSLMPRTVALAHGFGVIRLRKLCQTEEANGQVSFSDGQKTYMRHGSSSNSAFANDSFNDRRK